MARVPSTRRGCVVGPLTFGGLPFSHLGCCGEEGGADAAALQGFQVDFSRQRSLWRGTRPSGEVEWWELSDSSCSSRVQRGRSGSQAPDPWASSSLACVGARTPRGAAVSREGLGEATGRAPGPPRSPWRAKAPAHELRGIVRLRLLRGSAAAAAVSQSSHPR